MISGNCKISSRSSHYGDKYDKCTRCGWHYRRNDYFSEWVKICLEKKTTILNINVRFVWKLICWQVIQVIRALNTILINIYNTVSRFSKNGLNIFLVWGILSWCRLKFGTVCCVVCNLFLHLRLFNFSLSYIIWRTPNNKGKKKRQTFKYEYWITSSKSFYFLFLYCLIV